jgi:large subunit ribosomal protein L4
LADDVCGVEVNNDLLYEAVRQFQAGHHAGTHKTKTRREVSGSGKKLWKQKGTGRARVGSVRSPIWRHGGTVHGPVVRDYSYKLPKKMMQGALRSALSAKVRDGELKVIDGFTLGDHKAKNARGALTRLEAGRTVLIIDNGDNRNLSLSVRNLKGVTLLATREVNPYHLLGHKHVLISAAAARMRAAADQFGAESVLPYHYGGSNGVLTNDHEDARLFRQFGASRLARTLCAAPTGEAAKAMYGKMAGVAYEDYEHARLIVLCAARGRKPAPGAG